MNKHIRQYQLLGFFILFLSISGCTSHSSTAFSIQSQQRIILMPLVNYSQTPQAGEKAEAILENLWQQAGYPALSLYPPNLNSKNSLPPLNDKARFNRVLSWLNTQEADYYLTGSITEWRYKTGLDGEPAVGINLKLYTKQNHTLVWSASSARAGWDRESLSATAQKLIKKQIKTLK